MLVLSRKIDESIMIGDDIVVSLVSIRGDKVRLGIDAPSNVPIHRKEVYEAIRRTEIANQAAEKASQPPVAEAVADSPA